MKKIIAVLLVFMFVLPCALGEAFYETNAVTIAFDANSTTGFAWSGYVFAGDSAILDSEEGTYIVDSAPEGMTGVGGTTYYTLIPTQPGQSIVVFYYGRSWENDIATQYVLLADVDEDLNLSISDVTETGVFTGTVVSVDADDHSVMMQNEELGEVKVYIMEDMEMPVVDETIVIYTNGVMTCSLPASMGAIAWASVPSDTAR